VGNRKGSKRYDSKMTDSNRAEITNAIWLCRNCHKLIDTDDQKYSSVILFTWREQHERHVQSELGSATDRIKFEEQDSQLLLFKNYPPLIRRIVIDKPDGWEYRLTAEIMRFLNRPLFRKLQDLREGLYQKSQEHIKDEEVLGWVEIRLAEAQNLLDPIANLINQFKKCWGLPGEPGNAEEIHHICSLIEMSLEQIIQFEEQIYFVNVSEGYQRLIDLIKDHLGIQAEKLEDLSDYLDGAVAFINSDNGATKENPHTFKKDIEFEMPKGWVKQMNREIKRAKKLPHELSGTVTWSIILITIFFIWLIA